MGRGHHGIQQAAGFDARKNTLLVTVHLPAVLQMPADRAGTKLRSCTDKSPIHSAEDRQKTVLFEKMRNPYTL
jgi:hypothetical protein